MLAGMSPGIRVDDLLECAVMRTLGWSSTGTGSALARITRNGRGQSNCFPGLSFEGVLAQNQYLRPPTARSI
jgi:hypothetical protein